MRREKKVECVSERKMKSAKHEKKIKWKSAKRLLLVICDDKKKEKRDGERILAPLGL